MQNMYHVGIDRKEPNLLVANKLTNIHANTQPCILIHTGALQMHDDDDHDDDDDDDSDRKLAASFLRAGLPQWNK